MEREGITILAHLLTNLKDSVNKLEGALKDNDMEALALAKKEILTLQEQIERSI